MGFRLAREIVIEKFIKECRIGLVPFLKHELYGFGPQIGFEQ